MNERSYTVSEIDALRQACERRYLYGTTAMYNGSSRSFKRDEMAIVVEEMIRTYILAGITAEDIFKEDRQKEAIA